MAACQYRHGINAINDDDDDGSRTLTLADTGRVFRSKCLQRSICHQLKQSHNKTRDIFLGVRLKLIYYSTFLYLKTN